MEGATGQTCSRMTSAPYYRLQLPRKPQNDVGGGGGAELMSDCLPQFANGRSWSKPKMGNDSDQFASCTQAEADAAAAALLAEFDEEKMQTEASCKAKKKKVKEAIAFLCSLDMMECVVTIMR